MLRDKLRRPDKIYSESLNRRDEQSNCMEDPVPGSSSPCLVGLCLETLKRRPRRDLHSPGNRHSKYGSHLQYELSPKMNDHTHQASHQRSIDTNELKVFAYV